MSVACLLAGRGGTTYVQTRCRFSGARGARRRSLGLMAMETVLRVAFPVIASLAIALGSGCCRASSRPPHQESVDALLEEADNGIVAGNHFTPIIGPSALRVIAMGGQAIPDLRRIVLGRDPMLASAAAFCLGRINDRRATEILREALLDWTSRVSPGDPFGGAVICELQSSLAMQSERSH